MKLLGTISELVKVILRKSTYEVTVQPSTVTADTTFELPAAGGGTKAIVTADSSATLTNKIIDGDNNTVQDLPVTAIKTEPGDANKALVRDGAGIPTSALLTNSNVAAAAGIVYSKLSIADGDLSIAKTSGLQTALDAKALKGANSDITSLSGLTTALSTAQGGTGVNSTATFPSTGTVVTRDSTDTLLNKTTISSTGAVTGALTLPVGNTGDRSGLTTTGMVRFNTGLTSFEGYDGTTWSTIGGGGTTDRVTQASHAFAVGDVLYLNGATYTKARADAANTAEVVGMVSLVIDANTFEITLSGEVSQLTGLTAGEVYFLSPITAGATTATEPSVVGQVSLPIGVASSTTTLYVQPKRGVLVGATNVRTQIALANNATTTVQNVSAYDAGELSGSVVIAATASLRFFVSAQFSRNGAGTNYNVSYQASGDVPPVGFQITITSAGLLQVVMPSVAGFTSAAITYGLDVAAVGATLPLSISARNVIGDVSGTAVPAGYIGEQFPVSPTFTSKANTTTVFAGDVANITLSAGTWLVIPQWYLNGAATSVTSVQLSVNTSNAAHSLTGFSANYQNGIAQNISVLQGSYAASPFAVTVASSQQYFINSTITFTGGTCSTFGKFTAIRIG